jgi:FtsH-binding integral membrane protein
MEHSIFSRTEQASAGTRISANMYNLVIGLTLCWGFLINWLMIKSIPYESIANINIFLLFGGYFASCIFGIYLFKSSGSPVVSFIGYNFVVIPFGIIINLIVSHYNPDIVLSAVKVTGMVTFLMMMMGTIFPAFFQKISGGLSVALITVIIVEMIEVFIFKTHHGIMDWIVVLIFCGYIGFDWSRANMIPRTVDNAIDSAASLYMDIINLFIRILSILDRRQ